MADTIYLRRTIGGLKPDNALGEEIIAKIPMGSVVSAEIRRPRHLRHHRKLFALLQAIFPHQDTYPTFKAFRAAVLCAVGHCEAVPLPDGRTVLVPESISFAKLDQSGFEQLYDRALDLILTRILPGIDRDDVEREVSTILAGRWAEAA